MRDLLEKKIVVFVIGGDADQDFKYEFMLISPRYWGCNRSLFKDIFDIVLFIFLGQTTSEDKYYRTRRG